MPAKEADGPPKWKPRPWPEAVPRFVTARNPDRETYAPDVIAMSRRLGFEPMPWQVAMWETLYEIDPEDGGLWYREGRITVPRQSAKTTSTLAEHFDRLVNGPARGWGTRQTILFTMQNASEARLKIVEDWIPVLEESEYALEEIDSFQRSNGREGYKLRNGGRVRTFPPNLKGGHGGTVDQVDIDEAFAFEDDRAEQGARPAMITRVSPAIRIKSTAGKQDSSAYLLDKIKDGRARVESGAESRVYYLEYSIDPDVDDIDNEEHWPRWMPALGYTQTLKALRIEKDSMKPDEFFRAFGNGWTKTGKQLIPKEKWAAAFREKTKRDGKVWMAVDASPGEGGLPRSASISVASFREDGIHVEVVAHAPGIDWVAEEVGKLTRKTRVSLLYVDPTGPIGTVLPDIRLTSMAKIVEVDARTMTNACARFHEEIVTDRAHHRNQPLLNAAVEGAARRMLEDGWAWKRRTSTSDISPLVSCTLAHWAAATNRDRGTPKMHGSEGS